LDTGPELLAFAFQPPLDLAADLFLDFGFALDVDLVLDFGFALDVDLELGFRLALELDLGFVFCAISILPCNRLWEPALRDEPPGSAACEPVRGSDNATVGEPYPRCSREIERQTFLSGLRVAGLQPSI
jgi:hypothetical protein